MNEAVLALLLSAGAYDAHAKYALAMATAQVQMARPVAAKPIVAAPAGLHSHRCSQCGNVWSHGHDSYGKASEHTCPRCGTMNWNPIPYQQPAYQARPQMFSPPRCPSGG